MIDHAVFLFSDPLRAIGTLVILAPVILAVIVGGYMLARDRLLDVLFYRRIRR